MKNLLLNGLEHLPFVCMTRPQFRKKYDYLKKKRPHFLRLIIEILIDNSVYEIVTWKI